MNGYNVSIEGEFYSATIKDYVAVPQSDGEKFTLWTDESEIIAVVVRTDSGYYRHEAADNDGVWNDWHNALIDAATYHRYWDADQDAIKETIYHA
jgi:hypothetical protein